MSKGKSDKKKRRERKLRRWIARAKARPADSFRAETHSLFASVGKTVEIREGSGPKLSARIQDVAEPYLLELDSRRGVRTILETAVIAWNIALGPEDTHASDIEKALLDLDSPSVEAREVMREILASMVRRKVDLHPADRRYVANYQFGMTETGVKLRVVSTELPENP